MSVYKRKSGRYAVLVDLESTATGKRLRKSLGTYRTRKEAEAEERKALTERDKGTDLSPKTTTVAELIPRYVAAPRDYGTLATKTIERYEAMARLHIFPAIGSVTLARLRRPHITELMLRAKERGLSPKSVRHVRNLLHAALEWAVEEGFCATNVAHARVHRRRSSAKQAMPVRALTPAQAKLLLDAAIDTPWHAFFTLALCTGARRGELAALRWANVDFDRKTITISDAVVRTNAGLEFKGTKTGRVRAVPLNNLALDALRTHRVSQSEERLRKGPRYKNADFVFADAFGRLWEPQSASNAFARLARAVGIPTTRLHDLRHTAATWIIQGGFDAKAAAEVLGHSSPVTTLLTYTHVFPGSGAAAVEEIAHRLDRAESGPS